MADENKKGEPSSILGKAIEDIRGKVKPQAEENAENATDVTETKTKENVENVESTLPEQTQEEKKTEEDKGKLYTPEETNAEVKEAKDALASSGDDFESKYNTLMKQYNDLNEKYRKRFNDNPDADFSKPSSESMSAMKDAEDFASGKISYKDLFISDEGAKDAAAKVKAGYNPKADPLARTRYPSQTQSTAPTYYANSQTPQTGISENQIIGNKTYMSGGGSTIGKQASTDESYDDLFENVKKNGIKW